MNLVHLTSSTFFGGPERQMLGLAEALPSTIRTTFVSFSEGGRCEAFLAQARSRGFDALALRNDFPRIRAVIRELIETARGADVLLCHGYKANLLGRVAARRIGIAAVAVSRGWTGENRKVRLYEWLDRRHLCFLDRVVCVSDGQADKVRRWCGVRESRLSVIRNSARLAAFEKCDPDARAKLLALFEKPPSRIVLAAGRLSPEKGFDVLVEAAITVLGTDSDVGFVIFGEGACRVSLEDSGRGYPRIILPGFRSDLDALIAAADVVVLPSFTEGLPNVALEASAAGVPVVATAVGGTPEVVADGATGFLVPPGNPTTLAEKIAVLLDDELLRRRMGEAGRARMREHFTFEAQAEAYVELMDQLLSPRRARVRMATPLVK